MVCRFFFHSTTIVTLLFLAQRFFYFSIEASHCFALYCLIMISAGTFFLYNCLRDAFLPPIRISKKRRKQRFFLGRLFSSFLLQCLLNGCRQIEKRQPFSFKRLPFPYFQMGVMEIKRSDLSTCLIIQKISDYNS